MTGDDYFRILKQDVQSNSLPQVSWIVAPEAFSEHPNWPANYGAWYIDQVLQVLTSNPDLWSKTALLINQLQRKRRLLRLHRPAVPADVERQRPVDGEHRERSVSGQREVCNGYLWPRRACRS